MITQRHPRPDFSTLLDFVHGRLTREESLVVLDWIEHDAEVSRDFELVLSLMGLSREEWEKRKPPVK